MHFYAVQRAESERPKLSFQQGDEYDHRQSIKKEEIVIILVPDDLKFLETDNTYCYSTLFDY